MTLHVTPEYITSLKPNEIFVFGSNLAGMHGGGAAHIAHKLFGAEQLFRVTRIGCGIAGFTNEEIAPLFKAAVAMENVSLPNGWREIIG